MYVKKFVHFIVKLIFCVTGAANELQRSIMYDQTGPLISLNNELSSLEEIQCEQTLKSRFVNSFLVRRFDKYGRNKCVEISIKASTAHE